MRAVNASEQDVEEGEEMIVREVTDGSANSLLSKLDLSEVDIYTAYREDEPTDTSNGD